VKNIVLAGNAIAAEILFAYLKQDSRYEVVASTVDDTYVSKNRIAGLPSIALSSIVDAFPPGEVSVVMAVGYDNLNRSRAALLKKLRQLGYGIETYIHADAKVFTDHPVGEGSVILPGAVVEPGAQIGANTVIWCNATLAHHCSIGDHCWIASGAVISGQARVSANTFVGVNATIVNDITVGEFNVVGGGALITKDTKPHAVHLARSAEEWRYSSEDYVKYFGV